MRILLQGRTTEILRYELAAAKDREIGGILVGEHLEGDTFRIADISVQRMGGTSQHFMRDPAQHEEFLREFFVRTAYNYERYNYIGEWHSHTAGPALPSSTDFVTMEGIVDNPAVGVAFAILLVARLGRWSGLQLSATAFRSGQPPDSITLVADPDGGAQRFRQIHPRVRRRSTWI